MCIVASDTSYQDLQPEDTESEAEQAHEDDLLRHLLRRKRHLDDAIEYLEHTRQDGTFQDVNRALYFVLVNINLCTGEALSLLSDLPNHYD